LLLYLPFSEDIKAEISDSLFRSIPFLKINDKGNVYYTDMLGVDSGLFDRGENWERLLIKPQ
ncbi:hypothetical protein, partial [Pseudomonas sp. 2995-1]|uniref:hypothetical protein n=1 Tax=Pseudomonas sp. 2995-1 TaxID=1712679 RepID=UPI001C46A3AE